MAAPDKAQAPVADPALIIRPATLADAPAMAWVFAQAIRTKALTSYGPRERAAWIARGTAARFTTMLANPGLTLLVAEFSGTVVGLAVLEGEEVTLLYAGEAAPKGTGTSLLAALAETARQAGHTHLLLSSSRNALGFYLHQGFTVIRQATRPLPGGVALPVVLMVKTLN